MSKEEVQTEDSDLDVGYSLLDIGHSCLWVVGTARDGSDFAPEGGRPREPFLISPECRQERSTPEGIKIVPLEGIPADQGFHAFDVATGALADECVSLCRILGRNHGRVCHEAVGAETLPD